MAFVTATDKITGKSDLAPVVRTIWVAFLSFKQGTLGLPVGSDVRLLQFLCSLKFMQEKIRLRKTEHGETIFSQGRLRDGSRVQNGVCLCVSVCVPV